MKEKGFQPVRVRLINECLITYIGDNYVRTLILHKELNLSYSMEISTELSFQGREAALLLLFAKW